MKIGLVGVGRWGRTLAAKLTAAGAEIAAHDRAGDGAMGDRFGPRVPWQDMLGSKEIDAVVAATPPEVTALIFHACQAADKPCLLTKPLLIETASASSLKTTTYVDYVHLFSPLWTMLLEGLAEDDEVASMAATSTGGGPARSFPASLDYGPHALALLLDAFGARDSSYLKIDVAGASLRAAPGGREHLRAELRLNGVPATVDAGNDGPRVTSFAVRMLDDKRASYVEAGGKAMVTLDNHRVVAETHDPLARLVERFLWDAARGEVRRDHAIMSAQISDALERARAAALLPGPGQP